MAERTARLIGEKGVRTLADASVLVVGLGGVGGCVFELLVRAGVGSITAVDGDVFEESNLNRQLLSTHSSLGKNKAAVAKARAAEINPACAVCAVEKHFTENTAQEIFSKSYDYVVDCIDSVPDKTALIVCAKRLGLPVISAMGAGNRLKPKFAVTDIFKTSNDGLARVMRKKLREAGVTQLKTVCDTGEALPQNGAVGTISYAPNAMGCVIAEEILTELLWNA
ncbi:MAG: ThiF family adenylyltransferase [Clostridiales bacterium]|nr:ThiF family adenylyltransferase [Clostridiales bacterium]